MAVAAFVLATLAGTAVVAVLLLQRPPGAVEPVDSTRQPAPLSTTVANVPSPPRPVSPVESTPTIEVGPALLPQSEPQTARTRSPGGGASDTPATRSPISVAPERASRSRIRHHNKVERTRVICFPESACPDRYDARARRISSSPRRPRRRRRSRSRRSHRAPGLVPTTDRASPNRPTAVSTCIRTRTVAVSCSANGRYRSFYGHHR